MVQQDFTTVILVDQSSETAFNCIKNVRGWWSEEIEGKTEELHHEFKYHYEDIHRAHIKLIEVTPYRRIVWKVLDNYFQFTQDKSEWTGTKIVFDILPKNGQTEVRLTHFGLTPEYECYQVCNEGWSNYIQNSLYKLITTGKGMPNATNSPQTQSEKRLSSDIKNDQA